MVLDEVNMKMIPSSKMGDIYFDEWRAVGRNIEKLYKTHQLKNASHTLESRRKLGYRSSTEFMGSEMEKGAGKKSPVLIPTEDETDKAVVKILSNIAQAVQDLKDTGKLPDTAPDAIEKSKHVLTNLDDLPYDFTSKKHPRPMTQVDRYLEEVHYIYRKQLNTPNTLTDDLGIRRGETVLNSKRSRDCSYGVGMTSHAAEKTEAKYLLEEVRSVIGKLRGAQITLQYCLRAAEAEAKEEMTIQSKTKISNNIKPTNCTDESLMDNPMTTTEQAVNNTMSATEQEQAVDMMSTMEQVMANMLSATEQAVDNRMSTTEQAVGNPIRTTKRVVDNSMNTEQAVDNLSGADDLMIDSENAYNLMNYTDQWEDYDSEDDLCCSNVEKTDNLKTYTKRGYNHTGDGSNPSLFPAPPEIAKPINETGPQDLEDTNMQGDSGMRSHLKHIQAAAIVFKQILSGLSGDENPEQEESRITAASCITKPTADKVKTIHNGTMIQHGINGIVGAAGRKVSYLRSSIDVTNAQATRVSHDYVRTGESTENLDKSRVSLLSKLSESIELLKDKRKVLDRISVEWQLRKRLNTCTSISLKT